MRILLVEDETELACLVEEHLRAASHNVDHVTTCEDAWAVASAVPYDIVILDLRLPDGHGLSLVKRIRQASDLTPILIASAHDRVTERIAGLEAGADDYIVKPYDLDELLARVQALGRRQNQNYQEVRRFGRLNVQMNLRRVSIGEKEIDLSATEWAILDRLSRNPNVVISKSELEDAIYEFGREVASNAIEAHISRLRSKLGHSAVDTKRGFGYRMGAV